MLKARDFRAEKGRADLTVLQTATGAGVSPNTVVALLDEKKNGSVTLIKARLVMDFLKDSG